MRRLFFMRKNCENRIALQLSLIHIYSNELYLRSEKFCIDPKSTLGILAMMYSARDTMYLDTGDLDDKDLPKFLKAIDSYIVKDEE